MKANELKIGNWVRVGDVWYKIYSIHSPEPMMDENFSNKEYVTLYNGGLATCLMSDVKGIPLSEEWLEKFGAIKHKEGRYHIVGTTNKRIECFSWLKPYERIAWIRHDSVFKTIDFVHDLQNLYFALTAEELEIKE